MAAVIEAMEQLVTANGTRHVSVQALARRAGVSAGSIYDYFGNVDSVVKRIVELATGTNAASMEQVLGEAGSPQALLESSVDRALELFFAEPARSRGLITAALRFDRYALLVRSRHQFARAFAGRLVDLGAHSPVPTLEEAAMLAADASMGVIIRHLWAPDGDRPLVRAHVLRVARAVLASCEPDLFGSTARHRA